MSEWVDEWMGSAAHALAADDSGKDVKYWIDWVSKTPSNEFECGTQGFLKMSKNKKPFRRLP